MANDTKKKTESAADAPPSSGPAAASTPPAPDAKALGQAPTGIEQGLIDEVERLRRELVDRDGFLERAIAKIGESIGAGVAKALAAEREAQRPGNHKKLAKREVPAEFKGSRTYVVGPKGAYQNNRRFVQGERITVVDQFPASDWTPIEDVKTTAPQSAPVKSGRAADQTVG